MKITLLASLAFALFPHFAQAAIFDAPDLLPQNSGAVGVFGEMLLNDPTSEGVEARGRYGLSDDWNLAGILGTGSKGKNFRMGGEAVYNILPDWTGQVGLSALGTVLYLRRPAGGGIQTRVGIMGHKKIDSFTGLPATIYLAVPFYLEARKGTYTTGSQVVLGSLWDINDQSRFYASTEMGVKMGNAESYVLVGIGFRLGQLRFQKRATPANAQPEKPKQRDYRDEDFE